MVDEHHIRCRHISLFDWNHKVGILILRQKLMTVLSCMNYLIRLHLLGTLAKRRLIHYLMNPFLTDLSFGRFSERWHELKH